TSSNSDVSASAKTKFYSGKGGSGGIQRFPQVLSSPIVENVPPHKPKALDIETETSIQALQQKVRSLDWNWTKLSEFIFRILPGKRPSEFDNHDRMMLLYHLQMVSRDGD
ncbi:MAG: hypothetical protein ACR2LR_15450, partial [Hassallia sp.]